MAYFDIDEIKFDLIISGTTFDSTITTNWGPKADEKVNDEIYDVAAKKRLVTYLPVLPLQGTDLTQSVINASNHYVKQMFYLRNKNVMMADAEEKEARKEIKVFISKLKTDKVFYARIVR
jgi:hypothetical protein